MEALFKGQKSLFKGLYIYDKWDWARQNPVIRLDLGEINNDTAENLQKDMGKIILQIAQQYNITLTRDAAGGFAELIKKLHESTGQQVVVLIDEYDKPIIDHLSNPETADGNRKALKNFYQVLKAADEHLRFVFLTGVSKFAGVSVFSGLNNLDDLTLDANYASICGYTQAELENDFAEYIGNISVHLDMERENLLTEIRTWYDGYTWDGKSSVYNPFSTLSFFSKKEFANYWFRTGTPAFLIEILKKHNHIESLYQPIVTGASSFDGFDPEHIGEIPLLFQTGYLTIKEKVLKQGIPEYTLGVPNSEVNDALTEHLLNAYSHYPIDRVHNLREVMQKQIRIGDKTGLERSLSTMMAHIPYNLHLKQEAYYHSLLILWLKMLGFDIQGEVMTNRGRIDAVWHQSDLTVVAEIKYRSKGSAGYWLKNAMEQIRKHRYYEKYGFDFAQQPQGRKIVLLAVVFTGNKIECRIQPV
jgi:Holliday junction resolvase-like predicted endonuclease